jgi:uncharacterized membrane protein YcaP (DUF421 family)
METVLRIAIIYVFVLIGLRLLGKREFSQLSPFDLVMLLLIPEIVSQGLMREDFSLTNGLLGTSTILVLVFLTSMLTHYNKGIQKVLESNPTVLVQHGHFIEAHLNKERVPPDEVFAEMRKVGLERLEQVKWAILESDGKISIVPEPGNDTSTPSETDVVT